MQLTQHGIMKLLSGLPWVGDHFKMKLDEALLVRLDAIEARFSSASVRFATQLHDLYDCLKDLESPLEIEVSRFHGFAMLTHTKTSKEAQKLLERLEQGSYVQPEDYFRSAGAKHVNFLDWYSNEESVNAFVNQMTRLLIIYCTNNNRSTVEEADVFVEPVETNEVTELFMGTKWFKLMILDLIQMLSVILFERKGG